MIRYGILSLACVCCGDVLVAAESGPEAEALALDEQAIARAEAAADALLAEEAAVAAVLAAREPATDQHREQLTEAELRSIEAETLLQLGEVQRAGEAFIAAGDVIDGLPKAVHHDLQPRLGETQERLATVARGLLRGGALEVDQPAQGDVGPDVASASAAVPSDADSDSDHAAD